MKLKLKPKFKKTILTIIFMFVALIIYSIVNIDQFVTKDTFVTNDDIDYLEKISSYNLVGIDIDFLIWIDENYQGALENLDKKITEENYNEAQWHQVTGNSLIVLKDYYTGSIENTKIIENGNSITFLGDTSLADNYYVMQAYNERNKGLEGILSTEMIEYLNNSSVLIANSEFAFSNDQEPMAGKYYTFYGDPSNVHLYDSMGVDLVTLANNHIYDYNSEGFQTTLTTFDSAGIPRIGAGNNLEEASKAYYFIINGYKVSFINANRSEKIILTPGATDTKEGVFRCYEPDELIKRIGEEKLVSDIVIPIIHWGLEGSNDIEEVLLETGKEYIDAGADAIVGHHAHVLQGIEFYNGKPIIYNIGNFIFDNYSRELGVVTFNVNDDKTMEYIFNAALQEDVYTDFLYNEEKEEVLNDMRQWSINTTIDSDGKFYEAN